MNVQIGRPGSLNAAPAALSGWDQTGCRLAPESHPKVQPVLPVLVRRLRKFMQTAGGWPYLCSWSPHSDGRVDFIAVRCDEPGLAAQVPGARFPQGLGRGRSRTKKRHVKTCQKWAAPRAGGRFWVQSLTISSPVRPDRCSLPVELAALASSIGRLLAWHCVLFVCCCACLSRLVPWSQHN